MIDFNDIELDSSRYQEMVRLIWDNYGKNNGCILHPHWEKFSDRDFSVISQTGEFKSMSWMGGGFPETTDYQQPLPDWYDFHNHFANMDTIDVQSGIYQFSRIREFIKLTGKEISVIEIGGGYGRLAMFFLKVFGRNCHYVSVDFAPSSLLYAPQVMQQAFPDLKIGGTFDLEKDSTTPFVDYNFVSLPAWRTDLIPHEYYDLGVNIHSFQEMQRKSVDYYSSVLWGALRNDGVLYVVNNPPEKDNWYTNHGYYNLQGLFRDIYAEKYPIGDDWEKICGVPTLERILLKDVPGIIDTDCSECHHLYGMVDGSIETTCPKCGNKDEHEWKY